MKCSRCQYENPPGSNFCLGCGTRLGATCGACGNDLPAGSRFCNKCGTPVSGESAGEARFASPQAYTPKHLAEKILTSKSALEGERKQVTVLFCDIANSTALAERLGPEAMHDLLDRFFELALDEVHRYEGTVNQFLGDGFMALFGAPIAHEDDARRGVLAGLGIQGRLRERRHDLQTGGDELAVRMGLNTGFVVVGRIGDNLRMDYTAVGDTTNLAARLQQGAEPGTILISETTHRLLHGVVRAERVDEMRVKGKSQPVTAYRLTALGPRRSPLEERPARALGRFVGRSREVGLPAAESAMYLLHLFGVKEGTEPLDVLSPEAIKARTFETIRQMSLKGSARRPLLLLVEDVHWIDTTSEEYLAYFIDSLTAAPIFLVTTYRPGYRPPW